MERNKIINTGIEILPGYDYGDDELAELVYSELYGDCDAEDDYSEESFP